MAKGGTSTNTVSNQATSYNPYGLPQLQEIYGRANAASQIPYQPYGGQMVAGLSAPEQAGIDESMSSRGAYQPYFDEASRLTGLASQRPDVESFYNPFASNVFAAQDETFGKERADIAGRLTGAAGGVGASRIGVGQAELARQHELARGQTAAGLWGEAAGQAGAQRGRELGAGAQFANLGTGNQSAMLREIQALMQAGGTQRGVEQNNLTSQYQQFLQERAYPYQQAQFLASIGLPAAGAMGGMQTSYGNQNRNATQTMSPFQMIAGGAGIGTALLGADWGGGSGGSTYPGTGMGGYGGATAGYDANGNWFQYNRGGRVFPFASGGAVDEPEFGGGIPDTGSPTINPWDLHAIDYMNQGTRPIQMPSSTIPKAPDLFGGEGGSQQKQSNPMGDIIGMAAKLAPMAAMMINRGGRIPGYAGGGIIDDEYDDPMWKTPGDLTPPFLRDQPASFSDRFPQPSGKTVPIIPIAPPKDEGRMPSGAPFALPPGAQPPALPGPSGGPQMMPRSVVAGNEQTDNAELPVGSEPISYPGRERAYPMPGAQRDNGVMSYRDIGDLSRFQQYQQPKTNLIDRLRDPKTRSQTLMELGLRILAAEPKSTSGLGEIAHGALGTMESFDKFNKEGVSAKEKGQEMALKLKSEYDKYHKMTPYQAGSLDREDWQLIGYDKDGHAISQNKRSGEQRVGDIPVNTPVGRGQATAMERNSKYLVSIGAAKNEAEAALMLRTGLNDPNRRITTLTNIAKAINTSEGIPMDQAMVKAQKIYNDTRAAAQANPQAPADPTTAGNPGGSSETAIPDPGSGKRVPGTWYIDPSGKPNLWQGP